MQIYKEYLFTESIQIKFMFFLGKRMISFSFLLKRMLFDVYVFVSMYLYTDVYNTFIGQLFISLQNQPQELLYQKRCS